MTRRDVVLGLVILLVNGAISVVVHLTVPALDDFAIAWSVGWGFWWGYRVGAR